MMETTFFNWLLAGYGLLFAASLLLALAITPLARWLAFRINLVDNPGERKIHSKVMPYGGGIAIYLCSVVFLAVLYLLLDKLPIYSLIPKLEDAIHPYLQGAIQSETLLRFSTILGGATIIFLLGLYDDIHGLNPMPKLLVQFMAAGLVFWGGVRGTIFIDSTWVSAIMTILWIVAVTNAFNLLDNMDGLSAGVGAIASLLFFIVALQANQVLVAAVLAVLSGALLGFLYYNFSPARLFMGDAGSLLIGFLLATLTIAGTYHQPGSTFSIMMPVLILGVPLFDTASVMMIRWRNHKPFFEGDTNHFSHRLVRLGMTRREAVLTIYLVGLILGGAATLLHQLDNLGDTVILLIAFGLICLIILLETAAARRSD